MTDPVTEVIEQEAKREARERGLVGDAYHAYVQKEIEDHLTASGAFKEEDADDTD